MVFSASEDSLEIVVTSINERRIVGSITVEIRVEVRKLAVFTFTNISFDLYIYLIDANINYDAYYRLWYVIIDNSRVIPFLGTIFSLVRRTRTTTCCTPSLCWCRHIYPSARLGLQEDLWEACTNSLHCWQHQGKLILGNVLQYIQQSVQVTLIGIGHALLVLTTCDTDFHLTPRVTCNAWHFFTIMVKFARFILSKLTHFLPYRWRFVNETVWLLCRAASALYTRIWWLSITVPVVSWRKLLHLALRWESWCRQLSQNLAKCPFLRICKEKNLFWRLLAAQDYTIRIT